ncbi:MAG: helix-turn-helix transcriptional regulator [Bacteroidota bacterium]
MDMDFKIGENIRKIRELRGYSQDYMASQLDMSQRTYSNLEADKSKVDKDLLSNVANILEVDPIKLLTFDEKAIFTNSPQSGHYNSSVNQISQEQLKLLEETISMLKKEMTFLHEEIAFLRGLVQQQEIAFMT